MLSEHELSNIATSCTRSSVDITHVVAFQPTKPDVVDPKPAVYSESSLPDSPEKVYSESSLPDSPEKVYSESRLPDSPEKVNCPKSEDISALCVVHFPEDNVSQCLEHKFF